MLGSNETLDQLVMANIIIIIMVIFKCYFSGELIAHSGHWSGHVLRREDFCVLGSALDLEVEGGSGEMEKGMDEAG